MNLDDIEERAKKCKDHDLIIADMWEFYRKTIPALIAEVRRLETENGNLRQELADAEQMLAAYSVTGAN